ncbi:hypothetical protein [Mammaliicoccus sp. Dog046]|uniref:DUF3885 domain-containing protein n=1 Tax=Mammaliicoccus sp. Dog046 TaxID=3034233 RepID=UPI002B25BB60|nr:hypothetical protein [Mammaliicoccus sp. Dog046]WQK84943.1 hypothetical protein P3U32_09955 [Mammaliicoccus sp. Dog046]
MIQLPIYKKEFFLKDMTFHVDLTEGLQQYLERPEHVSVDTFSEYNPIYFKTVNENAVSVFDYVFSKYDHLIFVASIMTYNDVPKERTNFLSKYIKNHHKWKYHLQRKVFKNDIDIDEDFKNFEYYWVKIDKKDLRHKKLIESIANMDFPRRTPNMNKRWTWNDYFILSEDQNITFFMHDDTGIGVNFKNKDDYVAFKKKYEHFKYEYV